MVKLTIIVVSEALIGFASFFDLQEGSLRLNDNAHDRLFLGFTLDLNRCNTTMTNPPNANAGGVLRQASHFCVNSQLLLREPTLDTGVTSRSGRRFGRHLPRVESQAKPAGPVIPAAEGTVMRKSVRVKDSDHWIVLDHDAGVYSA